MNRGRNMLAALTIAGSDSGGGAGIQADLKTFASLGVHGATAVTCVTAQNPKGVRGIQPCDAFLVRQQIEAVSDAFSPRAVKTGMLYSASIVRVVASFFSRQSGTPLVVDPVMVATSGAQLLKPAAIQQLITDLLPLATVVTPNLQETEFLLGEPVKSVEDLREAARTLQRLFGCAALVKGGHLRGLRDAVDIFYDGRQELLLSARFIRGASTHGTGCTYSAAITAYLARGLPLPQAVQQAKEYITQAISQRRAVGSQQVLNCFWR